MNRLHREGCLKPGYSGSCRWTRDGEPLATIGLHASPDRLRLEYRRLGRDDAWEQIAYDVPLTWSPCTKGGARPYFLCPAPLAGRPCRRRVAKLYLRGRHFLCRHCQDLAYESQSEDAHGRLLRRKETLRQSMGGEPGSSPHLLPARPKGRWRRLHEARLDRPVALEIEVEDALADEFARRFPGRSLDDGLP